MQPVGRHVFCKDEMYYLGRFRLAQTKTGFIVDIAIIKRTPKLK